MEAEARLWSSVTVLEKSCGLTDNTLRENISRNKHVNASTASKQSVPKNLPCQQQASYRSGYKRASLLWTTMLLEDVQIDKTVPSLTPPASSDSVQRPNALYDQGDHEVNVDSEYCEGAISWATCKKNPGHVNFTLSTEFSLTHLPGSHRDEDIYKYIQLWAQLVVNVKVGDISMDRPEGYAFYNYRGNRCPITGTGKVADISIVSDAPCPCSECQLSDSPRQEWLAVWVMTAMHVVFDDYEASQAKVELFFDHDDDKDGVKTLSGLRVVDSNLHGDWSKFECVTHDLDLGNLLKDIDKQVLELGKTIKEKEDESFSPLAVIASHPHGKCKRISVGEWRERKSVRNAEENCDWTEYSYTTATCYGSSGGPVWIIGPNRTQYSYNYYNHVHARKLPDGLNMSGAGDMEKRWDEHSPVAPALQ